jgi:hypothetical protein
MFRGGSYHTKASMWSHGRVLTPEQRLWRAVLVQAFEDAEMTPVDGETAAEPIEAAQARCYLRADSPFEAADLKLVCDFAELPADRLCLWARRQYAPEAALDSHVECGGSPPLFLLPQVQPSTGSLLPQTEKREPGSRTPKRGATPQAEALA